MGNTTGNIEFASRERYSAAHSRASESLFARYQHNGKAFAEAVAQECFLSDAFLSPTKQRDKLTYLLQPAKVEADVALQTAAATAMHSIWKDFAASKAQTVAEKALGAYLAKIVDDAIEQEAAQDAEADVEERSRRRLL